MTKEYEQLLKEFGERQLSLYENACNFSEKILGISLGKGSRQKFKEAIEFCHLKISPKGAFSFSLLVLTILILFVIFTGVLGFLSLPLILIALIVSFGVFRYVYNYPSYLATSYRIKASSEMVLAIVYMSVSMKMRPNLENAVAFTSKNLTGPLARDLKELIWLVYTGKYVSMENAIDSFIEKWKRENEEFTEAISLIKTSFYEGYSERDKILNEAVEIVLDGTKERMKRYSRELKTSLTIINALGILMPIIGLVFFPMITIFMPGSIKPIFIAVGYNIILPLLVFWLMRTSLSRRPTTFHQPELERHKDFGKTSIKEIIIPFLIVILFGGIGFYRIYMAEELFNFSLLLHSLLIICGISGGIISYCFLSTFKKLKLRNEIANMESELGLVLFQLGYQIRSGKSIENGIEKIRPKIKQLKMSKMFLSILHNIKMFGMSFERSIFDVEIGAIYDFPSRLIAAVMKSLVEISKSGMAVLSQSMISISRYLNNMHSAEEYLKDILTDVTSTMKTQALLLAPLASGIVVALTAMMMHMMITLREWMEAFQNQMPSYGPIGSVGGGIFDSILEMNKMMKVQHFQIIVGIYMIEIVTILSIFLSTIENGEEKLMKKRTIGKMLLTGTLIYSFTLIIVYSMVTSLISIVGLGA